MVNEKVTKAVIPAQAGISIKRVWWQEIPDLRKSYVRNDA